MSYDKSYVTLVWYQVHRLCRRQLRTRPKSKLPDLDWIVVLVWSSGSKGHIKLAWTPSHWPEWITTGLETGSPSNPHWSVAIFEYMMDMTVGGYWTDHQSRVIIVRWNTYDIVEWKPLYLYIGFSHDRFEFLCGHSIHSKPFACSLFFYFCDWCTIYLNSPVIGFTGVQCANDNFNAKFFF